jgi:single-strand DNA-binding protein
MKGVNKAVLIGYVGKEPEIKPLKHGSVASIALATTDTWRNSQTGTNETRTEWHRVAIYGNLVDVVQQYVARGSHLYIEGKLKTRSWHNQQGQTQYITEIIIDRDGTMQMLGSVTNKEKVEQIGNTDASVNHISPSHEIQGNLKSVKLDGLLVDAQNGYDLFTRGNRLFLKTRYTGDLLVTVYDSDTKAQEDMQLYKHVLNNRLTRVLNIRNDGRLQAFDGDSDEYRELRLGLPIETGSAEGNEVFDPLLLDGAVGRDVTDEPCPF